MTYFLTSCTVIPGTHDLNPANGFVETLASCLPQRPLRGLYLASDPTDYACNDLYGGADRLSFENAGWTFSDYQIFDARNTGDLGQLIRRADLVILAGGHVPTQQHFFASISLRTALAHYSGVLVGISAGSMNSAELVYAQPERPGEAKDPAYQRFLPGLGVTKVNLLPHYNVVKDDMLDGLRIYEDITLGDSWGCVFYAIHDGSYLYGSGDAAVLRGEAYRICDGVITQVSAQNQEIRLP